MLTIDRIEKKFGGLSALGGVDLKVKTGEILGIIGPNGSGKTTLLNVITGVYPPSAGRITFHNDDITGLKSHQIARKGIARTFQNLRIFPTMTVFQNVWAAQHAGTRHGIFGLLTSGQKQKLDSANRVDEILDLAGLGPQRDILARNLPLPARRRLEIARVLAAKPQLILLDEPAGGMTANETADMAKLIRDAVAPEHSCIVIEHKMDFITDVCDRLCVLDFGLLIADGKPDAVLQLSAVQEAYLGRNGAHDA